MALLQKERDKVKSEFNQISLTNFTFINILVLVNENTNEYLQGITKRHPNLFR